MPGIKPSADGRRARQVIVVSDEQLRQLIGDDLYHQVHAEHQALLAWEGEGGAL